MKHTSAVEATHEGRWWLITVPGLGVTHTRRLRDADRAARELIAVVDDVELDSPTVTIAVTSVDGPPVGEAIDAARAARLAAAEADARASELTRQLASMLASRHVPVRDIGTILGVSHQRAHQLISQ